MHEINKLHHGGLGFLFIKKKKEDIDARNYLHLRSCVNVDTKYNKLMTKTQQKLMLPTLYLIDKK